MDLIQLDGCEDAFLLVYDDEMDAKVVCTALDDTSGYIRDSGLGTIRLVRFGGPGHGGVTHTKFYGYAVIRGCTRIQEHLIVP